MFETAHYFDDLLIKEFSEESDRAAVILVASMFDSILDGLLRNYLVPISTSEDELFDGPNAPFNSFSAKINIAHRLGLISTNFTKDLHLIRKIRNDFAHDIYGCNFNQPRVSQRVSQLCASSKMIEEIPEKRKEFGEGIRGDFLMVVSWMLFYLVNLSEEITTLKCSDLEPHYSSDFLKEARQKKLDLIQKEKNKMKTQNDQPDNSNSNKN